MKIVIVNGSPRKGNTYQATQLFKNAMLECGEVEFTEFNLPRDMPQFCKGCMSCIYNGEQTCPNAKYTLPVFEALDRADGFIFASPVYVMSVSGAMKNFLDHFACWFVIHRPPESMFTKKAFIISTTAGAGTGKVIKTIESSIKNWCVNRVYSLGFTVMAGSWNEIEPKRKARFEASIDKAAKKFYREAASGKKRAPYLMTRFMVGISKSMRKQSTGLVRDDEYWKSKGWLKKSPF